MSELERYIQNYFGVPKDELQHIADMFQEEKLAKGDFYLRQAQYCNKLSFIRSGLMRIYVDQEHREVTQWLSTHGSFITDLSSLVFEQPARFNITALTDVEVYTIYRHDYQRLGNVVPNWHQLEKLFIAKCFVMLEDRIQRHLSMSAEERYYVFFAENKELFNQVPLQYIASMLGMTPETFSRIRRKSIS